jgi:hypothetical protein
MTLRPCPREAEVETFLHSGHWPHATPAELRDHAAGCAACASQVLLTQTFREARAVSARAAQLPPPGVLWWRAQLLRRNAAVERIGRPILGAHIFAIAVTLLLACGIAFSQAGRGMQWLAELPHSSAFHLSSLWPAWSLDSFKSIKLDGSLSYLIPAVALLALLSGVVVYLATDKQ